ncbi:MAG: hypothetical protein L0Y39_08695, partial [Methylococcaceae bacterium]|nr:hypothetical protein [Methylococcaceae bacterium]
RTIVQRQAGDSFRSRLTVETWFLDDTVDRSTALATSYDPVLVVLSIAIACFSVYAGFSVAGRINADKVCNLPRNGFLLTDHRLSTLSRKATRVWRGHGQRGCCPKAPKKVSRLPLPNTRV